MKTTFFDLFHAFSSSHRLRLRRRRCQFASLPRPPKPRSGWHRWGVLGLIAIVDIAAIQAVVFPAVVGAAETSGDIPNAPLPKSLLRAESIVTGKEEPERTRGFREALTEIIVKTTGKPALATDRKIEAVLAQAPSMIVAFSYEDRMKHLKINDEQGTRDRPHTLTINVAEPQLQKALQQIGEQISYAERLPLSISIAVTDPRGTYIERASGSQGYEIREVLRSAGRRRGLEFIFPPANAGDPIPPLAANANADGPSVPATGTSTPAKSVAVQASLVLGSTGYWKFQAAFADKDGTPLENSPAGKADARCFFLALDNVTFDVALAKLADDLLTRMTAAQGTQVKRCPSRNTR